jgi:Tfp pilus assembly protein PilV
MVASALMGIGLAGLLTVIAVSEQFMNRAIQNQKAQMIADQMMEIIESDLSNINSYAMTLTTCTAATTANQWDVRRYEWCTRLANELGAAGTTNTRSITLSTLADGKRVVKILLQASNGRVQIIMTRAYDT